MNRAQRRQRWCTSPSSPLLPLSRMSHMRWNCVQRMDSPYIQSKYGYTDPMLDKIKHVTPSHPRWSISLGSNGVKTVEYRARKPLHRCVFFHYATKVKLNTARLFPFRHHMANKRDWMKTTSSALLWSVWVVEATENVIILTFFFILSSFCYRRSNHIHIQPVKNMSTHCIVVGHCAEQFSTLLRAAVQLSLHFGCLQGVIYLNLTLIKLAVQRQKRWRNCYLLTTIQRIIDLFFSAGFKIKCYSSRSAKLKSNGMVNE